MRVARKLTILLLILFATLVFWIVPVSAGDTILTNNSGSGSTVWFISGEASLVMNGFDLTPLSLQLPAIIDRVSIAVDTATPNTAIDVVIYQDANGGSPVDATLIGQGQVNINQSGVFTAEFSPGILVTQPVVWVGFYLPVDFRFLADTSGTSVLTYWAWQPGTRFNLASLSAAGVIGPADGSNPVNIDMGGKARITAEISTDTDIDRTPNTRDNCPNVYNPSQADGNGNGVGNACETSGATGAEAQITFAPTITTSSGGITEQTLPTGSIAGTTNVLRSYPGCQTLFRDIADIEVSYRDGLDLYCREVWTGYAPATPAGYARRELLYDISIYNDQGIVPGALDVAVSHCIRPNPADLGSTLVIGVAYGSPRRWEILPSQRIQDLICAEVYRGGNLSYFVANTGTGGS